MTHTYNYVQAMRRDTKRKKTRQISCHVATTAKDIMAMGQVDMPRHSCTLLEALIPESLFSNFICSICPLQAALSFQDLLLAVSNALHCVVCCSNRHEQRVHTIIVLCTSK